MWALAQMFLGCVRLNTKLPDRGNTQVEEFRDLVAWDDGNYI